jgi:glycosyltransferase involved in cell wall biosynthesis
MSYFVDAFITNSVAARDTLVFRCGISKEKVSVVYNGIDVIPENLPQFEKRKFQVITVANLNRRKGHAEYLQVIMRVLSIIPHAKFIFVGRDDLNGEIQRKILDADVGNSVDYVGFDNNVSARLLKSRLFVLPSRWGEGCPTSILEAHAHGLPVIAFDIDGIPEVVSSGVDGVLIAPNKYEDFANAICNLLQFPEKAEAMGLSGRRKVQANFIVSKCVNHHEEVIKKLMEDKNENPG